MCVQGKDDWLIGAELKAQGGRDVAGEGARWKPLGLGCHAEEYGVLHLGFDVIYG